jgi:hypothetical protein
MLLKARSSALRSPSPLEGTRGTRWLYLEGMDRGERRTNARQQHSHNPLCPKLNSGPGGKSEMRTLLITVLALCLMAIGASRASAQVTVTEFCSDNTPVSANGVFNIGIRCSDAGGPGGSLDTGGYSCSCNRGADLLPVIVEVNTVFGFPTPNGWQTIGQTLASTAGHTFACVNNSSGGVKIVPSCTVGTNASPCHNNDTCTDLSGNSGPSPCSAPGSNPTCQVCITCEAPPA